MQKISKDAMDKFYRAILSLENEQECAAFFNDICTIQELEALTQRLEVAHRLVDGESYVDINKTIGASTATISRVSKYLNYGANGYKTVIERLAKDGI